MRNFILLLFVFLSFGVCAQPLLDSAGTGRDTLPDVPVAVADTLVQPVVVDSIKPILKHPFTSDSFLFQNRLFFSFSNPVRYTISEKQWQGKEVIFYAITALMIFLGVVRNMFRRYLSDLFSSYFRTTLRQRQIKEQLLQNPLPSLIFNIFFIVSTAIFLSLLLQQFHLGTGVSFHLLAAYNAVVITIVYVGKFIMLKFFGWALQFVDATNNYVFVVFATNKILGVVLLPFSILLAFTHGDISGAAVTMSLIVIAFLFAYRYFLSYISVNLLVRINFFHFLLYLSAFEVLPLLLIHKLLFAFLSEIT